MLPPRTLSFLLALLLPLIARAGDPVLHRIGELFFLLPDNWRVEANASSAAVGVVFTAFGPSGVRMTVARLPAGAGPAPLSAPWLDALTAAETAEARIALEEIGLTPVAGAGAFAQEGATAVTAIGFDCKSEAPLNRTILSCTWSTAREVLRARLQFPAALPPEQAAELDAVRASLRFAGYSTLGFGEFRLTHAPDFANAAAWARLAPPPAPAPSVTMAPGPPSAGAPAAAPAPAAGSTDLGRLVQDHRGGLIIVEGGASSGSGFICQMREGRFLLTNQHVACEMPVIRLASLDRVDAPIGAGSAAVGHDIIRFATTSTATPLIASNNVDTDAKIGDPIVVLGNTEGARVVQPLTGKLVGIGPDRIEVTAEFLPGNSGSPIIHLPSGKVIGIATYLMTQKFPELTDSPQPGVRRFGYRLDSVRQWQPVAWPVYRADKAAIDQVENLTKDLARLIGEMGDRRALNASSFSTSPIYRPVRDFDASMAKKSLSHADRSSATQTFLSSIRAATQADIIRGRQTLRYDYFQHQLAEQAEIREQMYRLFDKLIRGNR